MIVEYFGGDNVCSLPLFRGNVKPANFKKKDTATQQLLAWCQHKTKYYEVSWSSALGSLPKVICTMFILLFGRMPIMF